jgi:acetylornithine aminotransferase/acetylornithine/N-succinyldiaminopimelate aminotransferase
MNNQELKSRGERYLANAYARSEIALVRGQGIKVWDADGKEYLDFVAGVAVNALGHCHPRLVAAVAEQAARLIHCSNLYWVDLQVRLAEVLAGLSGLDRVFFCNSGTEANEAALKLVRKYAYEKGHPERYEIIAMEHSFHGRTMGSLAATAQTKLKGGFEPLVPGFKYVPLNDFGRFREAVTPQTCAVILEPVQGEGGVYVAEAAYLKELVAFCREKDILVIFDEVQCGMGRTGRWFAFEHYGVKPDVLTLAKALGGGVPIGAMLAREEVAQAFHPGDHGSTFGGNPLACAAALAVIQTMEEEGLVANAARQGEYLRRGLEELAQAFPLVKEVRGMGLLLGMELSVPGQPIVNACEKRGLLINCAAGSVLRLVPPLIVTREDIDRALEILSGVLGEAVNQVSG